MTLRVACVGAGYFSRFHYDSWARLDPVTLVGSCNRDIDKAVATGLPAYDDLISMISEQNPDVLDIILPPVAHAETIRTTLSQGVQTLICQKPFCQDLEEAQQITAEVEAAGATLIVHENFRFQPWYRTAKHILEAGDLGNIHQITMRLRPGDGQGPRAYLDRQPYFQQMERFLVHETGVHLIDTFRFLLGCPTAVYADLRKMNPVIAGEDAGYVIFDYPDGVRAILDGNRNLDHATDNTRRTMGEALIEGTEGTLIIRGDGSVWVRPFGGEQAALRLGPDISKNFGGDCVHHLQSHVVSALLNGTELENQARAYLKIIEIEEAIYASAKTGTKIGLTSP